MTELANLIKQMREVNNFSQAQIAKWLNVDRTLISQWERGICKPNYDDFKKLCVIFDISADELLEIETPEQRKKIKINY